MDTFKRNKILLAINELSTSKFSDKTSTDLLLERCCQILMQNHEYCLIWAGRCDKDGKSIKPLVVLGSTIISEQNSLRLIPPFFTKMTTKNPAASALLSGKYVVNHDSFSSTNHRVIREFSKKTGSGSYSSWPIKYKGKEFAVINIYSQKKNSFTEIEISFLQTIIADISLALYSHDLTMRIQIERDFNKEIVDTMQAMLISISPCGHILSFNQKAEEVTGYKECEVIKKYWVDVLMADEHRIENQQLLSNVLKGKKDQMNFESCLLTRNKQKRHISWHASFRHNIEKGKLGLVLLGIDITRKLQDDNDLKQALSQWKNIFSAIQDPALIVSVDSTILDANSATFTIAKKKRSEVIGHKICDILHLGATENIPCPLEKLIANKQSRILETKLRGLHGNYLLTISPLHQNGNGQDAALLVARNLTEEELTKAEAIRSAQLASVGELAAGVAHEINNPINGIINYAQIIMDYPEDEETPNLLKNIKKEGKRIAAIVSNLLDFSRRHEESAEAVSIETIITNCLDLVNHRLKKDMVLLEMHLSPDIPLVFCNSHQIQQVLLNILSNARYALNDRYPGANPDKKLIIRGYTVTHLQETVVRITLTDHGTGIEQELIDRVFDPFYSSKPKGEGTGLGLSISHGLMQDNKGSLTINSEFGVSTTLTVDLPISDIQGAPNE